MPPSPNGLIPFVHVFDVARSIEFYRRLGFTVGRTEPAGAAKPYWAWLESGAARLMLAQGSGPIDAGMQAVLFYVYYPDVAGARAELEAEGLAPGPLTVRPHAPQGEFRLFDPDGYVIMAMQGVP